MAASHFSMPTDQNEVMRNTHLVNNNFSEIQTELPPRKTRGRKPGSVKTPKFKKNPVRRGMGIAKLEKANEEAEKRKLGVDTWSSAAAAAVARNPNHTTLAPKPGVVLQGLPSYGGGPIANTPSLGGGCALRRNSHYIGGIGSGHQIMYDPVWGFVENYAHELSPILNIPQVYNNTCDTCFKNKRLDGNDENVIRSNGGGFSNYTMIYPSPVNQGFFSDHRITNQTGSMEEFGSIINPRNGTGGVKEYEFFPGKYDGFSGNYGKTVSVATSIEDCSSTVDLSLKL